MNIPAKTPLNVKPFDSFDQKYFIFSMVIAVAAASSMELFHMVESEIFTIFRSNWVIQRLTIQNSYTHFTSEYSYNLKNCLNTIVAGWELGVIVVANRCSQLE